MNDTSEPHIVLQTERLVLRRFTLDDTEFILRQVNEPSWIRFIADSGVRTLEDARDYLLTRPLAMYERHGFGLWLAELKADGTPIGMCGLIRRDGLPDVDIGYALLPEYWGHGYAQEAAAATLEYGRRVLGLERIVAITSVDNDSSVRVLERIGLKFERIMPFGDDQHDVRLFATP